MKKIVSTILAVVFLIVSVSMNVNISQAATKLKVSTNRVSLTVGKTKIVSANKKVTWSSSNKKIATVKSVNGKKAKIKAVKSGSCKITAKYGKNKKAIQVTVKKKTSNAVRVSPTPVVTDNPVVIPPTAAPDVSSMPEITPAPVANIYTETAARITVTTVSSNATSARIQVRNDNSTEVIYGKAYQLQKLEDQNWKNVAPIAENMAFDAIGILLNSNTTQYIDVDWSDYYGKLENGQYRIIKEYSVCGVIYKIAAPFQLEDNGHARKFNFRTEELLDSHYEKHGSEFGDISKEEYLEGANKLLNSTSDDILTKTRDNGDVIFYNPSTNEFAIQSADGYIRTYFKPTAGIDYYNRV